VSECDREASIMRRPRPTKGCWAMGKNILSAHFYYMIINLTHDYSFGRTRDSWLTNYELCLSYKMFKSLYDN
jgi:hypothetical protein